MTNLYEHPAYTPLVGQGSYLEPRQQELLIALQRAERDAAATLPGDAPLDPRRRRRVEQTWEEMWAQPGAISETLHAEEDAIRQAAQFLASRNVDRIYLIGCGDSLVAEIAVRPMLERLLGIPCEAIQALEYAHYLYRNTDERTAVVTISSSGVTTRTVEALLRAHSLGAATVGISNTPGTPILEEADFGIYAHAERKGWPTQASTAAMAVLYKLGIEVANAMGHDTAALEVELDQVPALMNKCLAEFNQPMSELAAQLANKPMYLFSGGGSNWATVQFAAAKVRECTPDHAFAVHLEEYHHYNSQKAGDPLFLVTPPGASLTRALDTAEASKSWGGLLYVLTGKEIAAQFNTTADLVLVLPTISEELSPFPYVVPLQLFAYHLAMAQFANAEAQG